MKINPADLEKMYLLDLIASAIVPRPIAFVSTVGEDGIFNLAPFSNFTPVCVKPPLVCLHIGWKKDGRKKDTLKNIEFSKDFVINIVNEDLAETMNQASAEYPSNVDEFREVGLTAVKSDIVKAPFVAESPVNMECKLVQIIEFGEIPTGGSLIIGEIVLFHIKDDLLIDNQIDVTKLKPIGRLGGGGNLYCRIKDIFEIERPYKPY